MFFSVSILKFSIAFKTSVLSCNYWMGFCSRLKPLKLAVSVDKLGAYSLRKVIREPVNIVGGV